MPKKGPKVHTKVIASILYNFTKSVSIDLIPPVIIILTPLEDAVSGNLEFECTGSIDEPAVTTVLINGLAVPVSYSQFSTTVTFSADGEHTGSSLFPVGIG